MKRKYILAALALAVMPVAAQETYENAKVAGPQDLNGTARYVGMGGAMEALGADLSTISTNPAGVGLFRKSTASVSFGLVSQQDAKDFSEGNKTNMSFDQVGFVYAARSGRNSFVNFGFNYHKSRNFDFILSAADRLDNASQNKLTYDKAYVSAIDMAQGYDGILYKQRDGEPIVKDGELNYVPDFDRSYASCSQLDDLYARNMNYNTQENEWVYNEASEYMLDRAHKGAISSYDFNVSGNVNDRFYWGVTFGLKDVNYKHTGLYQEDLIGGNTLIVNDERKIDGSGFDMTFGVIFRPVEYSPFRIGLSVATPTWYDLTTSNFTTMNLPGAEPASEDYDFKLYTPWKFGISMGHTVGNYLALGASYEFADYAHLDTRYNTGGYYDYWGGYSETSESDDIMNDHTKQTLKGVSTLKLGAEFKPYPELAVRLGYNYVSPMYKPDGFKDGTLGTDGSYYSSATDYTNWEGTNRITAGLGYTFGKLNLDLAYQYSATNGNFSPFMNYYVQPNDDNNNMASEVSVSNKRHQLLFTIGYRF